MGIGFVAGRLTATSAGPLAGPAPVRGPSGPTGTPGVGLTSGIGATGAELVRVVDGDTLVILHRPSEPRTEHIRLLNVNTPERGRPGFDEATATLRTLVGRAGAEVRLVYEKDGKPEHDRYGRLLAYIMAGDRNVNVELVRSGWSRYETEFGEGRFPQELREAEAEARRERRGLWALGG